MFLACRIKYDNSFNSMEVVTRTARTRSAPQRMLMAAASNGDNWNPNVLLCPVAVRLLLMGEQQVSCRCSRHKISHIHDIEYDPFVMKYSPDKQLVIVAVMSSL